MANNNCLFRGKEAVLRAYRFNKVPAWAIFVGKDPMFSYKGEDLHDGEEMLEAVIDNLVEHMSAGTYQLRIYEDVGKGITNRTEYNYSFRFQLLDDEEYESRPTGKIAMMQRRIEQLESEKEEEEEDDSIMGRIGAFLKKRPDVENFLMQKIMGWANQVMTPKQTTPANMAGFTTMDTTQQTQAAPESQPPTSAELYNRLTPEERQKFDQAAYVLLAGDPLIGTHLMKLADTLQNNPAVYQALTKM